MERKKAGGVEVEERIKVVGDNDNDDYDGVHEWRRGSVIRKDIKR